MVWMRTPRCSRTSPVDRFRPSRVPLLDPNEGRFDRQATPMF